MYKKCTMLGPKAALAACLIKLLLSDENDEASQKVNLLDQINGKVAGTNRRERACWTFVLALWVEAYVHTHVFLEHFL